jgi:polar amino acid transport system substrate-binding protein
MATDKKFPPAKHINFQRSTIGLAFLSAILTLTGCATTKHTPIKVGIAPDYPPLVFEQGGAAAGAEVEMAQKLAAQLHRPVQFIKFRFEDLIPALQDGRIDIIMSGMSVTDARELRIAFSEPYLHNQLRATFTRQNADRFKTLEDILNTDAKIGVVPGTVADLFVQKHCPRAERVTIASRKDAAFYLLQDPRFDIYVDDTFALAQIVSENEASLTFLRQPLAGGELAWGVRPDNQAFLKQVNGVLAKWKSDGTLDNILLRWIPYLKKYQELEQEQQAATVK